MCFGSLPSGRPCSSPSLLAKRCLRFTFESCVWCLAKSTSSQSESAFRRHNNDSTATLNLSATGPAKAEEPVDGRSSVDGAPLAGASAVSSPWCSSGLGCWSRQCGGTCWWTISTQRTAFWRSAGCTTRDTSELTAAQNPTTLPGIDLLWLLLIDCVVLLERTPCSTVKDVEWSAVLRVICRFLVLARLLSASPFGHLLWVVLLSSFEKKNR